jgi:hypothetical protein
VLREGRISDDLWHLLKEIASVEEFLRVNLEIEFFQEKVCAYTINVPEKKLLPQIDHYLKRIQEVDGFSSTLRSSLGTGGDQSAMV